MQVVKTLDPNRWRTAVDEHPDGNIFHTPEMYQVFARAQGHKPELWAVKDDDQIMTLLLPVKITLMDNFFKHFTTRSVVYGDLLCLAGNNLTESLALLLDVYVQENRNSLFTELRHSMDIQACQPVLQSHGFQFEEHQNFLIDLDMPVEQVWGNLRKSARKKIRKAQNKDALAIEELQDRNKLATWYDLLAETYATAHIPLAHFSLFEAVFDILHPQGMAQFLLGRVEDQYVAASVALLYKDKIYGWYRGFERKYSHFLPNDLMVWHLLKWGVENNYRVFDFGGAGKPGQEYGPRQFKAKFGGELVNYGRSTCVHHPRMLKVSQASYELYRRLFLGGRK